MRTINKQKLMEEKCESSHNSTNINAHDTVTISRNSYYDLAHLITEDMPVYPGDPQPEFKPIATIEKQKVNVTRSLRMEMFAKYVLLN